MRGFTLLEIMLVLAIIAMASLVVIPSFTGLETRTFGARVREAHTLLNLARRTAVVSGQPSIASFTGEQPQEDDPLPESSFSVGLWSAGDIELSFEDITDREVEIGDLLEVTFYPEGGSTGGNLLLSYQGRLARIEINPFSGRVETQYMDEGRN